MKEKKYGVFDNTIKIRFCQEANGKFQTSISCERNKVKRDSFSK